MDADTHKKVIKLLEAKNTKDDIVDARVRKLEREHSERLNTAQQTVKAKENDIARLRADNDKIAGLKEDNAQLKTENAKIARLREEIVQLKEEIGQPTAEPLTEEKRTQLQEDKLFLAELLEDLTRAVMGDAEDCLETLNNMLTRIKDKFRYEWTNVLVSGTVEETVDQVSTKLCELRDSLVEPAPKKSKSRGGRTSSPAPAGSPSSSPRPGSDHTNSTPPSSPTDERQLSE